MASQPKTAPAPFNLADPEPNDIYQDMSGTAVSEAEPPPIVQSKDEFGILKADWGGRGVVGGRTTLYISGYVINGNQ